MVNIPNEILETVRQSGVKTPAVATWLLGQLAESGISRDASPAEWPEDLWQAYKTLREAHEPGACSGSAARLFEQLDLGSEK